MDALNDTSDDGSTGEAKLKIKYDTLERNYRRLLEVTTALTEALEQVIKGDPHKIERTLSHCMIAYPELFSLQIRKPPSRANFKTAYNTSVSDDGSDIGETETNTYEYFAKLLNSDRYSRTSNKDNKLSPERLTYRSKHSDREQSPYASDSETKQKRRISPALSFVTLDDNAIPALNQESSFEVLKENIGGYPLNNDVNIMSLYPKSQNRGSTNFSSDNDSSTAVSPVTEREIQLFVPDLETPRAVKHPESDTDTSIRMKRNVNSNKSLMYYKDEKQDPKKKVLEEIVVNNPMEIVVNNNKATDRENEFSIKIIPDSATLNKSKLTDDKGHLNANETCIIIKKNINSGQSYNGQSSNEIIVNSATDQISLNVSIAKLRSLSPDIHEQSNMFQSQQTNQDKTGRAMNLEQERDIRSPVIETNDLEEETRIALLNSYETSNKLQVCDEAFEEIRDDYKSIKYNLIKGSVKQKSLILQSLRLNLIHTLANERTILVTSYIDNDILNIKNEPYILDKIMPKEIINGWDLVLQQTIFKFLNTMSSTWKGRDYLSEDDKIIITMLRYFNEKFSMKNPSEAICKDMLIATFHKLSTRVNPQTALANAGIAEKVFFSLLENRDSITPYRLRHTLGLLINLCVNKYGRKTLESLANEMLVLLATLLSSKDNKIVSSAARLLYILMANEKYHKEANKMEISKIVEESMKVSNKRIKLQLVTLLSVIKQSKPHSHFQNADAEEMYLKNIEPEIDELEEEVEIGEPGVIPTQAESYKKYEAENSQKISNLFSKEGEVKTKLKQIGQNRDNLSEISEMDEYNEYGVSGYRKSRHDNTSNDDATTIDTVDTGGKSTRNDGKYSADSKMSKDTKKSKGKKGKKRDSDTLSMLSSNYTLLKEALDNIIDDQTNYKIIPEVEAEEDEKKETTKSITITQEKVSISSKTVETPKTSNVEETVATIKVTKNESTPKPTRPPSQISELVTHRSRKHSIYNQEGVNTYDYEYCEETKQIQLPLQHNNIFSETRESPLKGLLELSKENKLSKPNTPLITLQQTSNDEKTGME